MEQRNKAGSKETKVLYRKYLQTDKNTDSYQDYKLQSNKVKGMFKEAKVRQEVFGKKMQRDSSGNVKMPCCSC